MSRGTNTAPNISQAADRSLRSGMMFGMSKNMARKTPLQSKHSTRGLAIRYIQSDSPACRCAARARRTSTERPTEALRIGSLPKWSLREPRAMATGIATR